MILEAHNVMKYYLGSNKPVLNNINFSVQETEFVAIMGASGSGKTTLLNSLSTLDNISSGTILLDNEDVSKINERRGAEIRKNKLGFIFQDYKLLASLTARQNIALSLSLIETKPQDIDVMIDDLSEKFQLKEYLDHYPHELSGGQKQRIAIIRAIIKKPKIIIADEPTGALDSNATRIIMQQLAKINQNLNTTILMVTHDPYTASYAQRVVFLKDGVIEKEINRLENVSQKEFQKELANVMTSMEVIQSDLSDELS
ncbi:ABC transporter ATP-binding protein [Leuconostoc litchii]|uniref:ABC transporter ATP-binding protein n=2 Tax=Leuconostoc litchii TaxID=1981069 RepID=A0A6P2CL44_9LACO|nr:ABC transporter ATP-binding protein [Leuconostoc litchii]